MSWQKCRRRCNLTPMTIATDYEVQQERRLVTPIPGPQSMAMLARRNHAVSQGVGIMLPTFIERAGGGILVDVDGNHLIDFGSGIAVTTVGNANPLVAQGVQDQVAKLTHTCFMVTPYEGYVAVSEQLNQLTPGDHEKRSALFNTGAEAVENAVKIARAFTGRQAVVVVEHGYHGRTNLTMGMTAKAMPYKHNFGPFAPEIYRVPTSYPFRDGPHDGQEVAKWAIGRIEKEIGASQVAAIVIEPIQGEGGFIVPAPGYYSAMAEFARAHGILFVADEIQTGFCRTGEWFASSHEDVVPDLITTAKGIAGGMPLAGVTGRADVMDAIHAGGLGGTYGGNPVACAAAMGSIGWMQANDANALARDISTVMLPRLKDMQANHPVIGDIRGRGAMLAIELVTPGTHDPDPKRTSAITASCHQHGLVTLTTGTYGNVIRFLPPLTMPKHLLEEGLQILESAFEATS
jgi:4-aminobutyrate aminotransferase / (S)-3-amino-2-methylpropionate transaminase / 5-aminovalerate transaminase